MDTSSPSETSHYIQGIDIMRSFFDRTTSVFDEADSGFAPQPESFTVAQQVAHVAQTIDWFIDGAFGAEGFSLDFEGHEAKVREIDSLAEARTWLDRAVANAKQTVGGKTDEEMMAPLPEGPIMAGVPRAAIFDAISDHTAHHRGSLAVYARLLNKVSPMPYGSD
jgi:uncharacterized damage-inducible protein DinB